MPAPARSRNAAGIDAQPIAGAEYEFVHDYLLYLLARASMQASAQFHAIVKARGLSVLEWRVLGPLSSWPKTVSTLAEMALSQQPTLTKVLDRMAKQGLVVRLEDAADRRRVRVRLTAKGRALAAELVPLARDHEAKVLAGYAPREAAALKRTLKTLIARTGG
ncbi:MAG: winged helix DNA-binding protein [Rhodospirillaceae bacterium]|nr:winged helix DNA-binding protein [Rhodospirillaceae bacterium]